ncbi:hypothetical protein IWX50DRAFT_689549 [Phyllosticta citricarpa]
MTPKTSRASGPPRLPESLSPANTTTQTSKSRENKTSQHHCSDTKKTRRRSSASIFASVGALTPLTTLCRERRGVAVGAVRGIASHRRACNPAALVVGLVAATAPGPKQTVPMRSNFERRPEVVAFFAVSDDAGGRGATARAEAGTLSTTSSTGDGTVGHTTVMSRPRKASITDLKVSNGLVVNKSILAMEAVKSVCVFTGAVCALISSFESKSRGLLSVSLVWAMARTHFYCFEGRFAMERPMNLLPSILQEPLQKADQGTLSKMVAHMYSEHPETRSYVEPLFLVDNSEVPKIREVDPEYSSGEETDEEDSKPEATTPPRETPADATSSKIPDLSRKTHRFTTCYTCRKEYDVTENNLKACDFHIGMTGPFM